MSIEKMSDTSLRRVWSQLEWGRREGAYTGEQYDEANDYIAALELEAALRGLALELQARRPGPSADDITWCCIAIIVACAAFAFLGSLS